jgi:hypothetical protein
MKITQTVLLVVIVLLTACQPLETPTPPATRKAVVQPTATEPAAAVEPSPERLADDEGTKPAEDQATALPAETAALPKLPPSTLFDVAWDDRSPFRADLVRDEQGTLESLPGASVYHIDVALSDDLTQLRGRQEVRYTNQEEKALQEIVMRLFPNLTGGALAVSNLTVNDRSVEPQLEMSDSTMRIPLPEPLLPGEQVVLGMDFSVEIPTDESSNYGTFAYLDETLALAHAFPMIAVYDDEGWNAEIPPQSGDIVYADSSFYLVRVRAPDDLVIAASGITIGQEEIDGRQVLTMAAGPARDFYLAANPDYTVLSQQVGETTINSYAFPEISDGSALALAVAVQALETFAERFGPYPHSELDLVATPTSALGVEYPGIMAINQTIYEGSRSPFLEGTTAHEVGHQWFYNAVGNDQIDEPWLDEALVQYITMLYFEDAYGPAGREGFRESLLARWDRVDGAEIPIGMPVEAYPGPDYGAIVYGRGPLFFEALAEKLGEETFESFLRDYYETFKWNVASGQDLKALAESHCDCDLTDLFEEWVY